MATDNIHSLRLWPAWLIVLIQAGLMIFTVTAEFDNFTRFVAMMAGPLVCTLGFIVYLLGFSRLGWRESLGLLAVSIVAVLVLVFAGHESVRSGLWVYGVPLMMLLVTLGLTLVAKSSNRFATPALLSLLGWAAFAPARLDGFDGTYIPEFAWRWSPQRGEQRLTNSVRSPKDSNEIFPDQIVEGDWPGFRGPQRDSQVLKVAINTDWAKKEPKILWTIPVGLSWSSMSVVGDWLFTQEQLGNEEAVVCYNTKTGQERWRHVAPALFKEIVSGPGPRATPTVDGQRLYTVGGTGLFHALEAGTGKEIWMHDLIKEYGARLPEWGFSCSPLVMAEQVVVYVDGKDGRGLVAFQTQTGKETWHIPISGMNYASAQKVVIGGVDMMLFVGDQGLLGIEPATGKILFDIKPTGFKMAPMVQPQLIDGNSIILAVGDGAGSARVTVTPPGESITRGDPPADRPVAFASDTKESPASVWSVKQDWETKSLKPAFNDFVQHDGALFGFDQNIFACIDAKTGSKLWKKGRYGFGQAIAFPESKAVLVVAESGEIILIAMDKKEHRELGTFPAVEGKTWNHPAFAHGVLFVRSGEEMAAIDILP
ncbi:PQQ-like beta-propeller repeat protein [bacterium]|nr:PQQ-like beta-propeller repeat protein [bacterium]